MRITPESTIAIIIDVQGRLFPVMHEKDFFLNKLTTLVQGLKVLGIDCMLSEQYKKGLGDTIEPVKEAFGEQLPKASMRPEKKHFSVLDDEDAKETIQLRKPSFLILAGIESHVCVLQTALDAKENGYTPIVVTDAVTSRNTLDKETALKRMQMEGVRLSSVESILLELCRVSGTDQFKLISKLIK